MAGDRSHHAHPTSLQAELRLLRERVAVHERSAASFRAEAQSSAMRLQEMADALPVLIAYVDRSQRYRFLNSTAERWYGCSRHEAEGRHLVDVLGNENYALVMPHIQTALAGTPVETDLWLTHADGERRFLRLSFRPELQKSGAVDGYWVLAQDLTTQQLDKERIRRLVDYDALTDLPTRQTFQAEVERAVQAASQRGGEIAVILLDLDRFKQVNESLGHEGGDRLLRAVAVRLLAVARETSLPEGATPPIARYGGEEFALMIEQGSPSRAMEVACTVRERLAMPFQLGSKQTHVSATSGIALWPSDARSAEDLLRKADMAMRHGKKTTRGSVVCFDESLERSERRRAEMEERLDLALAEGAFSLEYQAQQDARSGDLAGAEVLLRWNDARLGPVSPSEFVPVAEDIGLIVPIGEWVFARVCEQCHRWDEEGFAPIRMGVNLSPRQLRDPALLDRLTSIIRAAEIDPGRIELEITESALIDDVGTVARVLGKLKEVGFQLALDDFGTGYSSLSYLRRFPIDRVKIDQSFVSGIPQNREDCEVTSAVIAMAHKLRLGVVAEGVETAAQAEFLVQQGCDEFQGFLFGRAETPARFTGRMERVKATAPEVSRLPLQKGAS